MKNSLTIQNKCRVVVEDANGNVISEKVFTNITCDAGRNSMLRRLADSVNTDKLGVIQHIAIGSSSVPATVLDTRLGTETARSAVIPDKTTISGTSMKVYARFGTGYATTISEAGVFVDATSTSTPNSGTILCHSLFTSPVIKGISDAVTIEWTIAVNNLV